MLGWWGLTLLLVTLPVLSRNRRRFHFLQVQSCHTTLSAPPLLPSSGFSLGHSGPHLLKAGVSGVSGNRYEEYLPPNQTMTIFLSEIAHPQAPYPGPALFSQGQVEGMCPWDLRVPLNHWISSPQKIGVLDHVHGFPPGRLDSESFSCSPRGLIATSRGGRRNAHLAFLRPQVQQIEQRGLFLLFYLTRPNWKRKRKREVAQKTGSFESSCDFPRAWLFSLGIYRHFRLLPSRHTFWTGTQEQAWPI